MYYDSPLAGAAADLASGTWILDLQGDFGTFRGVLDLEEGTLRVEGLLRAAGGSAAREVTATARPAGAEFEIEAIAGGPPAAPALSGRLARW